MTRRTAISLDCEVTTLVSMQDEGRFTVAQLTFSVSECISLITDKISFPDPSFIFVHQIYIYICTKVRKLNVKLFYFSIPGV